jgi:GC-rich sequence DNA-binding factor
LLLQKLVLPLAKQLLAGVWSPYSRRQSRAAAAMLADLLVYVPADDEALQVG